MGFDPPLILSSLYNDDDDILLIFIDPCGESTV